MTSYTATIEVATQHLTHPDTAIEQLIDYHGAIGTSVLGRIEATITLPADTLAQAAQTACAVVSAALSAAAVSVDVLLTDDADRRQGLATVPELLSVTGAAARLGTSRQALQQRIAAGSFPAVRVGEKFYAIPEPAVAAELATREHRTDSDAH